MVSIQLARCFVRVGKAIARLATTDEELRGTVLSAFEALREMPSETTSATASIADEMVVALEQMAVIAPVEKVLETDVRPETAKDDVTGDRFQAVPRTEPRHRSAVNDPGLLAARCRLKAEGCRWAEQRFRLKAAGASHMRDIAPRDRQIIQRERVVPGCHLWMNRSTAPVPQDLSLYNTLGGCFEALADSLELLVEVETGSSVETSCLRELFCLLAEAQCGVRSAVLQLGARQDEDQRDAHALLRERSCRFSIFIDRFMRTDASADPANWPDLLKRAGALKGSVRQASRIAGQRRRLIGKLRYQLSVGGQPDHWSALGRTIEELSQIGVPPSSTEIREVLLPHITHLPSTIPGATALGVAVREAKTFQENRRGGTAPKKAKEPAAEVTKAATLLRAKSLVLIGGNARPNHKRALEKALGLKELIWIQTRPGMPVSTFEPYIARPDVAAVLLAIRWSSHQYGDVRHYCQEYGKPLVRLPTGYNAKRVAVQILAKLRPEDRLSQTPITTGMEG